MLWWNFSEATKNEKQERLREETNIKGLGLSFWKNQ